MDGMAKMFKPYVVYEHCNKHASLYMKVLSVIHANSERVKLKINYIVKHTGRVQYTGKGVDHHSDTVCIALKDFKNWEVAKSLEYEKK